MSRRCCVRADKDLLENPELASVGSNCVSTARFPANGGKREAQPGEQGAQREYTRGHFRAKLRVIRQSAEL